jgi:predicted tellurium resistance membrane protein TerC
VPVRKENVNPAKAPRIAATVGQIVNPTTAMLAPFFLLLIGAALIAGGFGFHIAKGYIYAAFGFSGAAEGHAPQTQAQTIAGMKWQWAATQV